VGLGESAAARVLRTIGESRTPVKTLSGYIRHLADKEAMERNARGIPPAESAACSSGPSHGGEKGTVFFLSFLLGVMLGLLAC
jgi:RNA-dependent RNA polymerase